VPCMASYLALPRIFSVGQLLPMIQCICSMFTGCCTRSRREKGASLLNGDGEFIFRYVAVPFSLRFGNTRTRKQYREDSEKTEKRLPVVSNKMCLTLDHVDDLVSFIQYQSIG